MNRHNDSTLDDGRDEAANLDVLIGRIVDGEASVEERQRFEALAATDGALWRRLALRQQDMSMLAAHVEPTLNASEKIDLPLSAHAASGIAGSIGPHRYANRTSWWAAAAGWAAMIALAATWSLSAHLNSATGRAAAPAGAPVALKQPPEKLLGDYLRSPFVLGEMTPTMLTVDELPDGRLALSFLRRIVEVNYYDSAADLPGWDAEGNLTVAPHEPARADESADPTPHE